MVGYTANAPGSAKAPSAGQPGMGAGNVPHAPGMMSGNFGQQTNQQPMARQVPQPQVAPASAPPAPQPPGQVPQPGVQPGMMGQVQPINPQFYVSFLNMFFSKLQESVQTGQPIFGGY